MSHGRLDEAALREPLRRLLRAHTPVRLPLGANTAAAVLVPLFDRDGETHVWLMRRPATMRSHAGQVSFPGGKSDAGDASLLATALRETHEEVGIAPEHVDVLGSLDDHLTGTGFAISPWVGWVSSDACIRPNPMEVERAFAAPLQAFRELPRDSPQGSSPRRGWTVDGEHVWGATAAILRTFVRLVDALAQSD